jgi:hypothetical protein
LLSSGSITTNDDKRTFSQTLLDPLGRRRLRSDESVRVYLQQIMCSNRMRFAVKHETS